MLPRPSTEAAVAAPPADRCAPASPPAADLALRLAQRAFAALIEHPARAPADAPALRAAQLRKTARRTLSALSADDRARLARWLALVFGANGADPAQSPLARVDVRLTARIGVELPRARADLSRCADAEAAA